MERRPVWIFGAGAVSMWGVAALIFTVLVSAVLWYALHTRVRMWFWDQLAERPLTESERLDLVQCRPPAWWTWLKVVQTDVPSSCGEAWLSTQLADKLGSEDRALWITGRIGSPDVPAATRIRVSTALALAGWDSVAEPAWLADELDEVRFAEWVRAATESDAVAAQVGPRLKALGTAARVRDGQVPAAEGLPALEWLAQVEDPMAEDAATRTAVLVAGGYPEIADQVRSRRAAGRPVSGMGARWMRTLLVHPECGPRCGPMWTEIADQVLTDEALETGNPRPPDPVEPGPVAEWMTAMGRSVAERRAVAWAIGAAAEWVKSAPDPAARLRTFATRPAEASSSATRLLWDGVGPPFLTALVVQSIGELAEVPVEVRVGEQGDLWFRIGGRSAVRTCGAEGPPPDGPPWPQAAVLAASLIEQAAPIADSDPVRALRLAVAAQRLDPLVGGPLAVRLSGVAPADLEAGRRIGVGLLGPMTLPSGADNARRRAGEHGLATCSAPAE